jgi:hypothetical protein
MPRMRAEQAIALSTSPQSTLPATDARLPPAARENDHARHRIGEARCDQPNDRLAAVRGRIMFGGVGRAKHR